MNPITTLINTLDLNPHPEGGYYRRIYESNQTIEVTQAIANSTRTVKRPASTAIYYLLSAGDFSAWHRIQSDESWHHHLGGDLIIRALDPATKEINAFTLGNPLNNPDASPFITIKQGLWFCATPAEGTEFTLCSCSVTPGFDFEDFELASYQDLSAEYPEHSELIRAFTR